MASVCYVMPIYLSILISERHQACNTVIKKINTDLAIYYIVDRQRALRVR